MVRFVTSFACALMLAAAIGAPAHAQTELSASTDANGFLDVQALTCAQLADTYQEDADMLAAWPQVTRR